MSTAKTLLPKIQGSPYFIKDSGRAFSQILFKPGYPLQSAELITLQNIINEQIKRFGNHIFEDGSVVTSKAGLTYDLDPNCDLYELAPGWSGVISKSDQIVFRTSTNKISTHTAVGVRYAFEDSVSGNQYPDFLAVKKEKNSWYDPGTTVDIYLNDSVKIGSLRSNIVRDGRYCEIDSGIFYVDGYFTNIAPETYIYHVDETLPLNTEVGIELVWEIVDINHPVYSELLYDPAENAFNENSPGADRLILKLQLAHHPLGFENDSKNWKFVPLIKFENNSLVYRVKYPTYSVLGETLANRTYEINGNFVVDDFKLEVEDDALLLGTHYITKRTVEKIDDDGTSIEERHWTVEGVNTNYSNLDANNYLIFGTENRFSEINYKRLLQIHKINNNTNMILSDIHYDDYEDPHHLLQYHWDNRPAGSSNIQISLRDEDKLSYTVHEGLAYVQGWRFDKEYTSKIQDHKARQTETISQTVAPNRHYFVLDYDEHNSFVPNVFVNSSNFISFENLEEVDLHCTINREFYRLTIKDYLFNSWSPQNKGDTLEIDGALFVCVNSSDNLYEIVLYTKSDPSGVPTDSTVYSMRLNGLVDIDFELDIIEKIIETPYKTDSPSNYMSLSFLNNKANTTSFTNDLTQFEISPGTYNGFSANDYILITDPLDNTFEITGKIASAVSTTDVKILVKTQRNLLTDGNTYTITRPSEAELNDFQYNSTKIGTIRANSISANNPDRFYFSHYNVPEEFLTLHVQSTDSLTKITVLDLKASFASSVYKNMFLEANGYRWQIKDYDGETQTFTVEAKSSNAVAFSAIQMGDKIKIFSSFQNVSSIVKTNYPYGKAFKGNIKRNTNDYPIIQTPTGSQQKFARLINEGDGEVKSVKLNDHSYNIFVQEIQTTTLLDEVKLNYTTSNIADVSALGSSRTKVYAGEDILVGGNLIYFQGESIPIISSGITLGNLSIKLGSTIPIGTTLIIHLDAPIVKPELRIKNLQKKIVDGFTVSSIDWSTSNRESKKESFQLNHSDVYRLRKVEIAAGKKWDEASNAQFIDVTHYFDLDNGQRETFYDRARINLKQNLSMPVIAAGSDPIYGFRVTYDYFKPEPGHFFTVNSYEDIHYREIPVYTDPTNRKFPLRNVIDFRPVRTPADDLIDDFDSETDFTSDFIDLSYEYYLNENKTISIEGSSASEIDVKAKNTNDSSDSEPGFNIKLYQLKIPAYTFEFDDIEYKKIDNRRYTMNDISKLQKRIENLEDIAQLNSLELQTIQTKLITSDGDPRYKNGMLVDMFAGFTVADVKEPNFKASIDLHSMKMHPQFESKNFELYIPSTSSVPPRVNKNIVTLPFTSVNIPLADSFSDETTFLKAGAPLKNGKFTLHPFSDTWYSQSVSAKPLANEDNQYKNWSELRSLAHGTQWGDWEQYIYGVETEEKEIPLQNATLSQKTGSMVNNKNNIEKIIGNHKINTTLNYFSRGVRVGFVFERLSTTRADESYQIQIREEGDIKLPSMHAGVRIHYKQTNSINTETFKKLYTGYEITSTVTTGTAKGVIRHIVLIDGTADEYYLYVSNIEAHVFENNKNINEMTGTVSLVHKFDNTFKCDSENNILCADFELTEKEYPMNSIVDVRLCAVENVGGSISVKHVEGSAKFHISGLIEKMTSHCHSIRPVQKKLFSHKGDVKKPYIDDRTYKTNSSTPIPTFLHQPFVLEKSMFLSQVDLNIENLVDSVEKFILTIQPIINDFLSPSLIIPFSESLMTVPKKHEGLLSIVFDVPVFLSSNKDYAIVLRSESDHLLFRTKTSTNNDSVFYTDCYTYSNAGAPVQKSKEKIQAKLHYASFKAGKTHNFTLKFRDQSTAVFVDQSRLNISSLNLADTECLYKWKARNHDATVMDSHYTSIAANKTQLHEKRKVFSHTWYEISVEMNTSNNLFSPVIDLERASVTTIQHNVNDGSMNQNLITGSGVRTGSFTDDLRVIMTEKLSPLGDSTITPECSFTFDVHGNIRDFDSDPNFLVFNSEVDFKIQKWDGSSFQPDPDLTDDYTPATDSYKLTGNNYVIDQFSMINEFHQEKSGNPGYRYFSPIVTLADDFEAMELYIQMDAILHRSNEAFVYYRVLESSKPLEDLRKTKFSRMKSNTQAADKYSNNNRSRTLEFETTRASTRFKYFQVKVCFTSTNFVEIPIVENIRILALDN
jgi:hypothetical protein